MYDYPTSTLTLNITVISDPAYLKFSDGIARQTYQNALTPNRFARVSPVTARACHGSPGMLSEYFNVVPRTRSVSGCPGLDSRYASSIRWWSAAVLHRWWR